MTRDNWLLYDGHCPFCSKFARLIRLRQSLGEFRMLDARNGGPEFELTKVAGLSLDHGMVLSLDGQLYHAAECLHVIALISTPVGLFNRVNAMVFRSRRMSHLAYPVLRFFRNLTLRVLGRYPLMGNAN